MVIYTHFRSVHKPFRGGPRPGSIPASVSEWSEMRHGACWRLLHYHLRLLGLQVAIFGAISTFTTASSQRARSQAVPLLLSLTFLRSTDQNKVSRRVRTHSFCPDRGTPEPLCTLQRVLRASQAPVHRIPHQPCPAGTTSAPRARANTCAPSRRLSPSVHTL